MDGTAAGTFLLKDINLAGASADSYPSGFTDLGNGTVVFSAYDGASGNELWATNGTSAGTVQVKDLLPGTSSSDLKDFTPLGNSKAILNAYNGPNSYNSALWVTDGTAGGTVKLKENSAVGNYGGFNPKEFLAIGGGKAIFTADDSIRGSEPWITDGTAAGTTLITDLTGDLFGSFPSSFTPIGNEDRFSGI